MPGVITTTTPGGVLRNIAPGMFDPFNIAKFEWIVGDREPGQADISTGSSIATMSGYLYDRNLLDNARAYFLGYSVVDGAGKLRRFLPAFHPDNKFLRCTKCSIIGEKYAGKSVIEDPQEPGRLPSPLYERYRFDLTFEGLGYNCKTDAQVDDEQSGEWGRFLTIEPTDENETIEVTGGAYKFVDTTGASLINGKSVYFPGPALVAQAERSGLLVTAYDVNSSLVLDPWGVATKFLSARARVNSTTFLGRAPGTMLLMKYEIVKKPQPMATVSLTELVFGCDVRMYFSFTDPPRADPAETHRGWLLTPGPKGTNGGAGWYYAETVDGGLPLYSSVNMNALLTKWSLNDL